ncbi:MAG: 30S ribosomal protein S20 [Planctomycetes bacterium]|nr:30S ribosomal protein S20 [Planctomycetota bacterium]
MAHTKQAAKRHRQNLKARASNKAKSTKMKSAIKSILAVQELDGSAPKVAAAMKAIDNAAKHHVIHKNTAARYKSRVSRAVNRVAKAKK